MLCASFYVLFFPVCMQYESIPAPAMQKANQEIMEHKQKRAVTSEPLQ